MKIPTGCATGAYVNGIENLSDFQSVMGKKLAAVLWYIHWGDPFPKEEADLVCKNGSIPLLTWEPWLSKGLDPILNGEQDAYIRDFIKAAKQWGKPLFLRFAHEMNGDWYPWDGAHNGSALGPEKYKKAWLYIYNVRKELKADNISLVWCPNNTNQPSVSWNIPEAYYPGDQYVDWVGIDGYNWGYDRWQSFDDVFRDIYTDLTELTRKPLMIGEFSAAEEERKPNWIKETFEKIKKEYPGIKLFCWFNVNKERDWRVNSSPAAAIAFKEALQDSYFLDRMNIRVGNPLRVTEPRSSAKGG